jgi:hypothetical protein
VATQQAITLNENNDENVIVTITTNQPIAGTALNITGKTIEAYLKVSAATSDTDGSTWKGSTALSTVTINDGPGGTAEVLIPAASITTSMGWWRVDVITSGKRKTAVYGPVTVTDL